jgi:hypothetical protein
MSDSYQPPIDWSQYERVKTEIQSALRQEIGSDIQKIIDRCQQRGMNQHFISGLELAADTALFGPSKLVTQQERLFD